MGDSRSRRQVKAPRKFGVDEDVPKVAKKYVLRLLSEEDITKTLLGKEVFLLWPDDGLWYPAEIQKVQVASQRADVIYTTTDEEENISLIEVINDKSLAFREARTADYQLKPNEILDKEERPEVSSAATPSEEEQSAASDQPVENEREPDSPQSSPEASPDEEEDDDDDEELVLSRQRSHRKRAPSEEEEDAELPSSTSKRRRVFKAEKPQSPAGARPRRQITLSTKAQQLLSVEKQAQLEAILQSREAAGEDLPISPSGQLQLPAKDEFSTAEEYEQKLLSQISGLTSLSKSQSARRSSSLKGQASSNSALESEIREKAVEQMTAALSKVAQEAGKGAGSLPDAKTVATEIETALHGLYGDAGKDYKAKYRSLIFNLRDSANPDLRRRVLLGEIPPAKLVRYSANELASKQLSQWREEKEKEALKAAVLDTQAAAKFSTAAALASKQSGKVGNRVDWRDSTLATASPPRDQPRPREGSPSHVAESTEAEEADQDAAKSTPGDTGPSPSTNPQADTTIDSPTNEHSDELALQKADSLHSSQPPEKEPSTELPSMSSLDSKSTAIKPGSSFNWSNIRATALQEWENNAAPQAGEEEGEPEYTPSEPAPADRQGDAEPEFAIAQSSREPEQIWHGVLGNASPVPLPVAIEYIAGNPALASLIPSRQMDVKGRVALDRAEEFMRSLKTSRSRIISLALMRLAPDASEEEKVQLTELSRQYEAKERCGVLPHGDSEFYFVARSQFATRLLNASKQSSTLKGLPPDALLLVCVHRKDLRALDRRSSREGRAADLKSPAKPQKRNSIDAAPQPPAASPGVVGTPQTEEQPSLQGAMQQGGATPPPPSAPQPVAAPQVASQAMLQAPAAAMGNPLTLPQGIDLSSLGSLAAVLGVSQGLTFNVPSQQGQPMPQSSHPVAEQQLRPGPHPSQMLQNHAQPQNRPSSFPMHSAPHSSFPGMVQQQQGTPSQWGGGPLQFQLPPPPGYRPPALHQQQTGQQPSSQPFLQQTQHAEAIRMPGQIQHQRPPGNYSQGLQQPQQQHHYGQPQNVGLSRPNALPPPGMRPITLQPPGPPSWRPRR